MLIKLF